MDIWVDADACPGAIKEILFRAAERTGTRVTLVANQYINTPRSRFVSCIQVISKGCLALSPRGELFTEENIKARLNIRDFMETMRSSGIHSGGHASLSSSDKQAFGNQLDRWLQQRKSSG